MTTGGKTVVGLLGPKGAGKTTAASALVSMRGFRRVSLADPIKDMLAALGLTRDQLYGDLKEKPSDLLCGATPRHAMQTLGTEWRDTIHPELWTRIARERVLEDDDRVVLDDVRFAHEARMIRGLGGVLWLVRRPGHAAGDGHISETYWRRARADATLRNDGDVKALRAAVVALHDGTAP